MSGWIMKPGIRLFVVNQEKKKGKELFFFSEA